MNGKISCKISCVINYTSGNVYSMYSLGGDMIKRRIKKEKCRNTVECAI